MQDGLAVVGHRAVHAFTDSFRFPPRVVLLVFAALIYGAAAIQPTMTLCSGHGPSPYFTSPPAVTSRELASFLDAVCAGAYGAAHRSHNMSSYVAGTNRTVYGVAECRPGVPVPDCAACLAAASARLIAGRTECAAAAVWHDVCFLRYSDGDPVQFRDGDECTTTVFNATSTLPPDVGGGAGVRRLLAAAAQTTMRSHMSRGGVGASTAAAGVGARIYGLTRCAAGVSCADCRRCLRGALAAAEREYNGSAGMQILQLSCTARYESYPFYNTARLQRDIDGIGGHVIIVDGSGHVKYLDLHGRYESHPFYNTARLQRHGATGHVIISDVRHLNGSGSASYPAPAPPATTPPGGQTPLPSSPAENPRPPPPPSQALTAVHHAAPPAPAATPPGNLI